MAVSLSVLSDAEAAESGRQTYKVDILDTKKVLVSFSRPIGGGYEIRTQTCSYPYSHKGLHETVKTRHHLIHYLSHGIMRVETAQNGYQHDTPQAGTGIKQNTREALAS